jgi:orotidine-5'-phosphate decarboxylase
MLSRRSAACSIAAAIRRGSIPAMPDSPTVSAAATPHPADRLLAAIARVGSPVCVGLDPVLERMPRGIREGVPAAEALRRFGEIVIEGVEGRVAAIKLQSACFERHGPAGFAALADLCLAAKSRGLEVVLDAKRGDIGISAGHYAHAAREVFRADWTTVNGYFGPEGCEPFRGGGCGAFVLVRTSNPDGGQVQSLRLADGRSVAEAMAEMVERTGATNLGAEGFGDLGAVVGATHPEDAAALRERMPRVLFLVPGFGAQGGGAAEIRPCFDGRGRGAVVTASRSVIYPDRCGEADSAEAWRAAIAEAAARFADEVSEALPAGVRG